MDKILEYLKMPSTWKGFVTIATGLGAVLKPDLSAAIIATGASVFGLIEVLRKEKKAE